MSRDLVDDVDQLLDEAASSARDPAVERRVAEARERLHGPLRVAFAGKVKAGKSTLLNALLGEELAPTDAGECTKIITWYRFGARPQVLAHTLSGAVIELRWNRDDDALDIELGELTAEGIDHLEVAWPTNRLRDLTLLDTPGIASISAEVSARTHQVLSADQGRVPVADAVIYLMRHTHASDIRFLESFHDDEVAHGTPMNTVGVLSRADEIGSCRLDAIEVATTIARRYENDVRLHRLCPVVLPVDGLLGFCAVTLREIEYALLSTLAALSPGERGRLLLTADRFTSLPGTLVMTELERAHLLQRLGLFGVRLAVELIAGRKVASATELAAELSSRSGLDQLRDLIGRQFNQRSRILKVRSTLAVVDELLAGKSFHDPHRLADRSEQITTAAHDFAEVRVLGDLRSGAIDLRPDRLAELDRLIGGRGHDACTRLGLAADATSEEVTATAIATLETWRRVAEHPLASRSAQVAARVGVRTIEGLLAARLDSESGF